MHDCARPDVTVVICTFNRSTLLEQTLRSVARMHVPDRVRWDVLIVDNNCTDDTRQVLADTARTFPVPLHTVFESQPGKSSAFNRAVAASCAPVLASVDDDVIVSRDWLMAASAPLLESSGHVDYTGGPVDPIWEAPPPAWFPIDRSDLWGTLAILDYGREGFVFEERRRVPIGANIAFRRDLFDRVGPLLTTLGRSQTQTILGQELPEFFRRGRAAQIRGLYVPSMRVSHHVPAHRLTRQYFRRWWFGKGVCRARVDRLHPVTELGLDLRAVPHVAGVPRFMIADAIRDAARWTRALLSRSAQNRAICEMRTAYLCGYVWERWSSRLHACVGFRSTGSPPTRHQRRGRPVSNVASAARSPFRR
jgi:glucosyl-dolichyl phosphate glucuronosyltransferase